MVRYNLAPPMGLMLFDILLQIGCCIILGMMASGIAPASFLTDMELTLQNYDREIGELSRQLGGLGQGHTGVSVVEGDHVGSQGEGAGRPVTSTPAPVPGGLHSSGVPAKLEKPLAMPDIYSGQSSFKDWLVQFEICKNLNKWTNAQACQFLAVRLKGSALQVFSDLDVASRKKLEIVTKALQDRFDPVRDPGVYWAQLKGRVRKKGESLVELAGSIQRTVSKAHPTMEYSSRELIAVQHLIDAVENKEVQKQVRRQKPATVNQAMSLILDEESYLVSERQTSRVFGLVEKAEAIKSSGDKKTVSGDVDGLKETIQRLEQKLGYLTEQVKAQQESQRNGLLCYQCKQPGHQKSTCPLTQCFRCQQWGHMQFSCPLNR